MDELPDDILLCLACLALQEYAEDVTLQLTCRQMAVMTHATVCKMGGDWISGLQHRKTWIVADNAARRPRRLFVIFHGDPDDSFFCSAYMLPKPGI
eukprot:gene12266-13980_t